MIYMVKKRSLVRVWLGAPVMSAVMTEFSLTRQNHHHQHPEQVYATLRPVDQGAPSSNWSPNGCMPPDWGKISRRILVIFFLQKLKTYFLKKKAITSLNIWRKRSKNLIVSRMKYYKLTYSLN